MKKLAYLLLVIPFAIQAQFTSICNCNIDYGLKSYHTGDSKMKFSDESKLVIKTYFLIEEETAIERDLGEEDYLAAIAYLNINYNQFNIFFKYSGFEFIEDIGDYDNNYYPDRINFRIQGIDGGAVAGFPNPLNIIITHQAFTNDQNKQFLIAHEVGHILGLRHTNGNTSRFLDNFTTQLTCNSNQISSGNFPSLNSTSENVTRDETDTVNYNADETGDLVTDTPATYFEVNLCLNNNSGTPILEYLYSDEVVDATNTPYEDIDVNNFMVSDNRIEFYGYNTSFTEGQGIRMRETIENEAIIQAILTPVSSLYEPYKGNYYVAGPSNPDDKPLFQPGFDYKFVSAGGQTPNGYQIYNTPSDYEDTTFVYDSSIILKEIDRFSLDLDNIYHPNRSAIVIEQLEDQPRRCYHNVNRAISGGKIIKFNDGVLNGNYTIIEKNSSDINQPTLIQDLENGLYLIRKQYNDGTQEQKIILKQNNN